MRRAGHIRERSPGSYELRYSLGIDEATGKRKIVTTTFKAKTLKAAEAELRRLLRTVDLNEHVDPTRMTLAQWLATWLGAVREEVAPKSHERYGELVDNFLVPKLGNYQLSKLAPAHIQEVYTLWATGGRRDGKKGGLSPLTRRHIHRVLSAALGRAVEQQLITRNPADVFRKRLPKVERKEMVTLTPDQSATLLNSIKHSQIYWAVLVALATGMRRGEVLALRWRNVDLDRGTVRVVESLEQTKTGLRFKSPKTERARAITLPAYATDELRRLKKEQAENLLKLGIRQSADTLVCGRQDGDALQPHSLTDQFQRFVSRFKDFPRVRFHDLRHSHATQLLVAGIHPKIAQERLGHATITTTLDLYSHVTETMQEDAASKLDAAFQSAITGRLEVRKNGSVANSVAKVGKVPATATKMK